MINRIRIYAIFRYNVYYVKLTFIMLDVFTLKAESHLHRTTEYTNALDFNCY